MKTKWFNRVLAIAVALCLVTGMVPGSALATSADDADDAGSGDTVYVAQIDEQKYETLAEAVEKAEADDTITLLSNASISEATVLDGEDTDFTIDLSAYTLSFDNADANLSLTGGANLTLQNGNIEANELEESNYAVIRVESNSSVTLNNVTFTTNGAALYPKGDAAAVNVYSSTINAGAYAVATNAAGADNYGVAITLEDSDFNGDSAVFINVPGTLTMDNCTVQGIMHGVIIRGGTATIKDSTITMSYNGNETESESMAAYFDNRDWGTGNMVNLAAMTIGNKSTKSYQYPTDVTLINTTLKAEGKYGNLFPALYANGNSGEGLGVTLEYDADCTFISGETENSIVYGENITVTEPANIYVAQVGNNKYTTLAAAITAATNGQTVVLLSDVENVEEMIEVESSITLNLNGHTISSTADDSILGVYGGLTITDESLEKNGTIVSDPSYSGCYAVYVEDGNLTLLAGTLKSTVGAALYADGTVDIKGGAVIGAGDPSNIDYNLGCAIYVGGGSLSISDGSVTCATGYAVYINTGMVAPVSTITGGTFTGANGYAALEVDEYSSISVSGGAFSSDVTKYCAEGFAATDNSGVWVVGEVAVGLVAQVLDAEGNATGTYTTLAEAINAAENGQTVQLLGNVDISTAGVMITGKSIILDLNGHDILAANTTSAGSGNIYVTTTGGLTLKDSTADETSRVGSGKIYATTPYAAGQYSGGVIVVSGRFTMESGYIYTVIADDPENKGQFAVVLPSNTGSVTINGGKIEAGWYTISGNGTNQSSNSIITVNGGELISTADYAIYHPHSGTLIVNGGTIYGAAGGIAANSGTIEINGGLITSKGQGSTGSWGDGTGGLSNAAIHANASYGAVTVTITDGTITAQGDAVTIQTGAKHTATVAVSGGTFSSEVPKDYCADGFEPKDNGDGTFGVIEETSSGVAAIGDQTYATLQEAINAANNNDTVILLADVTESVAIAANQNIILNLDGHTLTNTDDADTICVALDGTLTVVDNSEAQTGTVNNTSTGYAAVFNNGTANLNGGTYTRTAGQWYTIVNHGEMTIDKDVTVTVDASVDSTSSMIENGYYYSSGTNERTCYVENVNQNPATLTIIDGTFSGGLNTVKNDEYGKLNISGGDFSNTTQYTVMNWNIAEITGGTFECNTSAVVYNASSEESSIGQLSISGGKFTSTVNCAVYVYSGTAEITDGTFSGNDDYYVISLPSNSESGVEVTITGGTYSSQYYCNNNSANYEAVKNEDGTYGVQEVKVAQVLSDNGAATLYTTLKAALNAATTGQTVQLLSDVTADSILIGSGVTLDLNGHQLTCNEFSGIGNIIDATEGEGKLVPNSVDSFIPTTKNPSLAIWDTDGYRFYSYTLDQYDTGYHVNADGSVMFCLTLTFENAEAWGKLNTDDNSVTVAFVSNLKDEEGNTIRFQFKDATVDSTALTASASNAKMVYLWMTFRGLENMAGETLEISPAIQCALFEYVADAISYFVPAADETTTVE